MTKEEFRTELEKVGPKEAAIIASRMALRVLPVLTKASELSETHWFAVLYAAAIAKEISIAADAADAADAAYAAARAAADARADVAARAAYAAARAARAADATDATDAAARAARAAYAADAAYAAAAAAFKQDILLAQKNIEALYRAPLWHEARVDTFEKLYQEMVRQLKGFQNGFEYWIEWYDEQLEGAKIPSPEIIKQRYPIPKDFKTIAGKNRYLQGTLRGKTLDEEDIQEMKEEEQENQQRSAVEEVRKYLTDMSNRPYTQASLKEAEERRNYFEKWGKRSIGFAIVIFALEIASYIFDGIHFYKPLDYFVHAFPILFPLFAASYFFAQANLNARELKKQRDKLIMAEDSDAILQSIISLYDDETTRIEETQKVMEKLTQTYLGGKNGEDSQEKEEKGLWDTVLDKKVTDIVHKVLKSSKSTP